ncbi:hypothetical protein E2C06_35810 [Dankookia rubra]|uniref:Uncharacterized protein n=1 Tax=Dankookia rubra TaxID=1442381 RepID=A0A4R5Q3X5_9PROT|nr:hypothetical protein [Dankookia rubra]TDH57610.1 hypothetical protein E2C06_35810 [Dankookia rubra]
MSETGQGGRDDSAGTDSLVGKAEAVSHGLRRTTGSGLVSLPDLARTVVTLDAPHMLALGAGALMLVCISFLGGLNSTVMWTLRLLAWAMIATVILLAP